jgi:hypothetical protein
VKLRRLWAIPTRSCEGYPRGLLKGPPNWAKGGRTIATGLAKSYGGSLRSVKFGSASR